MIRGAGTGDCISESSGAHQRERAGIPVDFSGEASKFMEGKTYKLDTGRNTPEAKKRAVVNDYMQDYERWKAAFPE